MSEPISNPPTYEAATTEGGSTGQPPMIPQSHQLQTRLNTTRTQHINTTISTHILPLIRHRTNIGLSYTCIALLPFNITTTSFANDEFQDYDNKASPAPKILNIVSSHGEDELLQIQLLDPIDSTVFWSQSCVLQELRTTLRESFVSNVDLVKGQTTSQTTQRPLQAQLPSQPQSKARSFFSRRTSLKEHQKASATITEPGAIGGVTVDVQMEEICLRTQSSFGLYETLTRPALIVRVCIQG